MAPPLLALQDIALTFGATPLLTGASLSVSAGDRLCLVGRNGSGKSTLLKIAAGLIEPDAGRRFAQPGATIRYLPQEPDFAGFDTTLAYVEAGMGDAAATDRHRAAYLLEQLGLTGAEDPAHLSGGEARRAALARVLAPEPDILLLDEPTNHLDLPGIEWLEAELGGMRSALVLISHDRRMLERMSRTTVWLDRGMTRVLDQGFAHFEAWRDQVLEQEELERHKLGRKIVMEEDWLRYGVTARRKRNVRRLADLHALRKRHKEQRATVGKVKLEAAEADVSGRLVIVAEDVSKAFDGRTVVRDVSVRVIRGDRLGIVGPNGAGTTTLLNILTGKLAPDAGSVKLGTNLAEVTLDQRRDSLDPDRTLVQTLTGGKGDTVTVNGQNRHVMSYMKDFLFAPEQANTPVGVLSGGERGRLTLALAFAQPSNLMVLDEPTNDLDLETLELLQERLADYTGTVLLVSHDRDFLDRVVTSVIASEGDGRWVEYAGGYSDMLVQRGQDLRAAKPSARPAERPKAGGPAGVPTGGPAGVPAAKGPSRKLSFKDKHALETLPGRMADLEAAIARLNAELANPDLYAKQPARFAEATRALAAAQASLAEAEEQWLTLEMLREELEGA
ncbi:MAG TPA: ABC-F family ATP-binding cassette domain-containing protein [Rhodopila sp.]|uniref:ABC-F family ATP-binding cassette domain-containing protein n=1 Tax=Rhodopila sp. TaxID=2480087 RepID=UPI002BD9134E|nr:ABC-F family ATP-binding cassette domain-containing protein [Rhodopila sp.]HVY14675.1 ABC-F family ATP-binding cassette domain-containing protein [Rhodopila sp.]